MKYRYALLAFILKRGKIIFVCWFAVVLALYFLAKENIPVARDNLFLEYLALGAVFLLVLIPMILTKKQIKNLLYMKCDPENSIAAYQYLLKKLQSEKKPFGYLGLYLSLSVSFTADGNYIKAHEMLNEALINYINNNESKADYYYSLLMADLGLGRLDEAEKALDGMIKATALLKYKSVDKYKKTLMLGQYSYNLAIGRSDYADRAFTEAFDKAKNNYERVNAKFWLGKVFLHNGSLGGARESFEYVIANGNKLYVVEEAKALLNSIA